MDPKIIDPANVGLVELIDLAGELANSIKLDVEDNPDAASDATMHILAQFMMKWNAVNDMLDNHLGIQ